MHTTAAEPKPQMLAASVLQTIGNTPLVKLRKVVTGSMADVVVKIEYNNPTGSYKDRMALAMVEKAEQRGQLRSGMKVVEYTGGNTGSALALVCAVKGYRFTPVSSDAFAAEKLNTMRAFGAELEIIPSDAGKLTPDLFQKMIARAKEISLEPGTYYTDQFNNTDVFDGYARLACELLEQSGTEISAFCGAVGTDGMLVGVSRALKARG